MKITFIIACVTTALFIGCVNNNNTNIGDDVADKSKKEVYHFSIESALSSAKAQEVLDPGISTQFTGGSGRVLRSDLVSKQKSNLFGKSAEEACQNAFLSTVKKFQNEAKKSGGTGVINLISNYKKIPFSSDTKYQCGVGSVFVSVALKGDIIH